MKFKTENYQLSYIPEFPFEIYKTNESGINRFLRTEKGIVYANGKRVELVTSKKSKTLAKFANEITELTANNEIVIAGDQNGNIKLFNYKKAILGHFDEHVAKINGIKIIGKTQFVSCGNDMTVKIFDFACKQAQFTIKDHTDFVQAIEFNNGMLFTGGLDKRLYCYNTKSNEKVGAKEFSHGINCLNMLDENLLLVGAKSQIFVIDIKNMEIIRSVHVSTKDISHIKIYNNIIYCSSKDGNLKTYNINLTTLSQFKFEDAIRAFDIFENEIYVCLNNGNIYKYGKQQNKVVENEKKVVKPIERYYRDEEKIVKRIKYQKNNTNEIEKLINNNQHWLAFTKILEEDDINVIFGSLSFIKQQKGLKIVLMDRKSLEIEILLDFIIDNFSNYELRTIFLDILDIVFKLYEKLFINDLELKEKLDYLHETLVEEEIFQNEAIVLISYFEALKLDIIN
ncbi:hypothetical protein COBT_001412 [Conglomerata obtusa]